MTLTVNHDVYRRQEKQSLPLTWVQCSAAVIVLELLHVRVCDAAAVRLAAVHLKRAEPGEHNVLYVLDAGVALSHLENTKAESNPAGAKRGV